MNVNDRGMKKWTSLMLPEHVEALGTVFAEMDRKEKPILDEQQKMGMNILLQMALKDNLTVEVTYFADQDYHTVKGKLGMINIHSKYLELNTNEKIRLDHLININIL